MNFLLCVLCIAFPSVLVFSNNFPNNAMPADELYHQHAQRCLFYTCRVLWLQLRKHRATFASSPGIYGTHLAFIVLTWHSCASIGIYCTHLAFPLCHTVIYCTYLVFVLCQLWHLLHLPGIPCTSAASESLWLPIRQKNLTQKSAAQLVQTGHQQDCIIVPGFNLLLDEFFCRKEEGDASEAVTAPAGFKLPSRNNHWCMYPGWVLCLSWFNDEP